MSYCMEIEAQEKAHFNISSALIVLWHNGGGAPIVQGMFHYQGMNPTIIVRQHDQGASISIRPPCQITG